MESHYYLSSSPIPYRIVCRLPYSTVNQFKFGLNLLNGIFDEKNKFGLLIYKNEDKSLTISRNLCRHAGGNFVRDIEEGPEIVRCTSHGWKLNTKTLEYIRPKMCLKQKQLTIEEQNDGGLFILEPILYEPWLINPQLKQDLQPNEMTITYLNHASIEIQAGNEKLIIDPWLIGPCFGRGWWLFHKNESDIFNRIANADAIFISKSFPDHFNLPTLREIAKMNRNIQIYIPQFIIDHFKDQFEQLGFTNVRKIPFGIWQKLKNDEECLSRFLILPDHKLSNVDSVILFEYKGHQILNLVDCLNPNGEYLPYSIDVLLTNFTSNTSAYPSCFIEQFDQEKILEICQKKDEDFIKKIIKYIQLSNPSVWIPFANYFIEAGPDDEQIRQINWKNNPQSVGQILQNRFPLLKTWYPFPDGKYDLGTKIGDQPSKPIDDYLKKSWNFQPYISQLDQSLEFEPLKTIEGIKEYFQWTKFNNYDLILHIIETNNDFSIILREYFLDFLGPNPTLSESCPVSRPLLRIRCRASVLRDIFIRGYSWINLYNGFSGRYFAQPNIYHSKFWNHFKYNLPLDPPQWIGFTQQIPPNVVQALVKWEDQSSITLTMALNSICLD